MKRVFIVLLVTLILTLSFSTLTMAASKVMVSYDMGGKYNASKDLWWDDDNKIYDTDSGFSVGFEFTNDNRKVEFGFGLESQLERSLTDFDNAEFKFDNMYGVMYINMSDEKNFAPFFVGRVGFNMHSGNNTYKKDVFNLDTELSNGLYYAVGFGFNSERTLAELLYTVNNSRITSNSDSDFKRNISYSKMSFVFGYKF